MKISFSFFNLAKLFLYLFLIFIPFQLSTLVFYEQIYFSGFFNPYLSHLLYLKDIFLFLILFFFFLSYLFEDRIKKISFGDKKLLLILFLLLLFACFSLFFASNFNNSIFYILRFIELIFIYLVLINKIIEPKRILIIIISVFSLAAFVGILQYLLQGSIGLDFLGEPIISQDVPGISKIKLSNSVILRPYSFFPHPNIFAGFLLFNIFIIYFLVKKSKGDEKILLYLLLFVSFLALFLTFSRSAFLAIFGGWVVYFTLSNLKIDLKKVFFIGFLIIIVFSFFDLNSVFLSRTNLIGSESSSERIELLRVSKYMVLDNYLGVGIGNFTDIMQEYSQDKLMPWEFQPVHNIYMLILNEQGILSLFLYLFLFYYIASYLLAKKTDFNLILISIGFSFLIIGFFDHYFISLYQGQLLLFIYLSLFSLNQEKGFDNH